MNRANLNTFNVPISGRASGTRTRTINSGINSLVYAQGTWYTETYELVVDRLNRTGTPPKTDNIYCVNLDDSAYLKERLTKSGEYRLLRLTATYTPLTAVQADKVALAPFFDPINRLSVLANFIANGRRIRRGDQTFTESWAIPSETTSVIDPLTPLKLIGGVCIFFQSAVPPGGTAAPDRNLNFGFVNVAVTYQFRGKKSEVNTFAANN